MAWQRMLVLNLLFSAVVQHMTLRGVHNSTLISFYAGRSKAKESTLQMLAWFSSTNATIDRKLFWEQARLCVDVYQKIVFILYEVGEQGLWYEQYWCVWCGVMWSCVVVVHHFTRRDVISIAISKLSSSHLLQIDSTISHIKKMNTKYQQYGKRGSVLEGRGVKEEKRRVWEGRGRVGVVSKVQ